MDEICCSESVLYIEARKRYINAQIENKQCSNVSIFYRFCRSNVPLTQETLIRVLEAQLNSKRVVKKQLIEQVIC